MKTVTFFNVIFTIVFIAIVATVVLNVASAVSNSGSVSFGIGGMTEIRCMDGYKFVMSGEGQARQILDEFGKGARCGK
jgi:hypothetical protein